MTEDRPRSKAHIVRRTLLPVLIGVLAGAGFNAMLGDQGADTPALALLGGGIALVVVYLQALLRARKAPQP